MAELKNAVIAHVAKLLELGLEGLLGRHTVHN
jgi:hypothetical protein